MNTFLIGQSSVTVLTNHLPLPMTVQMRIKVICLSVLLSIDHKTSTYQESLKNQVASNEDNEENKQGDLNAGNNPERVMDQIEAQDDQKIASLPGKGGKPFIEEEDLYAQEKLQNNVQEAAA